jgi:hypothetical protein
VNHEDRKKKKVWEEMGPTAAAAAAWRAEEVEYGG